MKYSRQAIDISTGGSQQQSSSSPVHRNTSRHFSSNKRKGTTRIQQPKGRHFSLSSLFLSFSSDHGPVDGSGIGPGTAKSAGVELFGLELAMECWLGVWKDGYVGQRTQLWMWHWCKRSVNIRRIGGYSGGPSATMHWRQQMNSPQITIVFQNSPLAEEWQTPQQAQPVGRRTSIPLWFRPKRQTAKRQRRRCI